jgi:hypothetical protein
VRFHKVLAIFILLGFNLGCEVYDEGFDLSSASDPCLESGANCSEPNGSNLLALSITNTNPAIVKSSNLCMLTGGVCIFDIAGLCNEADYSQNTIEYRVFNIDTNADILPITPLFNICKRGRFRFQVGVPATSVQTVKRMSVEIVGVDLNGVQARDPLAARREVDLLLIP